VQGRSSIGEVGSDDLRVGADRPQGRSDVSCCGRDQTGKERLSNDGALAQPTKPRHDED
jgi:hypothetical protein